jgi:hypothetical protein
MDFCDFNIFILNQQRLNHSHMLPFYIHQTLMELFYDFSHFLWTHFFNCIIYKHFDISLQPNMDAFHVPIWLIFYSHKNNYGIIFHMTTTHPSQLIHVQLHVRYTLLHMTHIGLQAINERWFHVKCVCVNFGWNEIQLDF